MEGHFLRECSESPNKPKQKRRMSYHLALRSLLTARRAICGDRFADCVRHSLMGDVSAAHLRNELHQSTHKELTVTSISDRLGELLAVDLNPVGHVLRLSRTERAYHGLWDAYNQRGNVVARVAYGSGRRSPALHASSSCHVHHGQGARRIEERMHERLLESYQSVTSARLLGNIRNSRSWSDHVADARVSAVARILGAGQLVVELCQFFEMFPHAKVQDACVRLGAHPRTVERRMRELGITAVMLKRVCMLTSATHDILWTQRDFDDIAKRHGYTDGAHLCKTVSMATGGITPSMCRSFVMT